jgi:predicted site-specific integrase-resolvase
MYTSVQMTRTVISELATPAEAGAELRVSAATIKRWLRDGQLVGVKLPSGEWRVPLSELRALKTRQIHNHRRRDEPAAAREPA